MSTLILLVNVMLAVAAAMFAMAPASVSSVPEPYDFDKWVKHVEDTCHPDVDEDPEDDDRMPSRPGVYDDNNFSKRMKEMKKKKQQADEYAKKKAKDLKNKMPGRKLDQQAQNGKVAAEPPVYVVAKDGSGDFETVQAAINKVPDNNKERVIIYVKKGIYREKVVFPNSKPFITLKGESAALTYIQWGDTASTKGTDAKPLGTYGSASVAVESDSFIALDISFKNTAPAPTGGAVGKQAVALRIQGDEAAFYRCSFYGAQDTLYDRAGRHYYYRCYIEGSIDFIFGDARSLFVKCHLHSIATPFGSISAQQRVQPSENTGYSFVYCVVTGSGTIYLGRAWGAYSRVVYAYSYFDNIIVPQGWNDFGIPANQKKVFYGEYKCFGPGANREGRVSWSRKLTSKQAMPFLSLAFIDGKQWLPK